MAVTKTVEHRVEVMCGKEYPVVITRLVGVASYVDEGVEFLADEALFCDFGPKQGITRSYTLHKDVEPTPEERAEGRKRIIEVATQCLLDQGIW